MHFHVHPGIPIDSSAVFCYTLTTFRKHENMLLSMLLARTSLHPRPWPWHFAQTKSFAISHTVACIFIYPNHRFTYFYVFSGIDTIESLNNQHTNIMFSLFSFVCNFIHLDVIQLL